MDQQKIPLNYSPVIHMLIEKVVISTNSLQITAYCGHTQLLTI